MRSPPIITQSSSPPLGNLRPDQARETIGAAVARLTEIFADAGIETARLDARILTAAALNRPADDLRRDPDALLDAAALARLDRMMHQRAMERMPVSRILGRREFWSIDFMLSPATLDPRPDSEIVVETALKILTNTAKAWRILDLGTGTGCLLLAVLSERPAATGVGTDISPDAIAAAAANAAALGLADRASFIVANWAGDLDERFDLILSNPPYIPEAEIGNLAPEVVRHDPRRALDGGADGLDAYRILAREMPPRLADSGIAILEIGADQAPAATAILEDGGLKVAPPARDLAGRDRCLVCRRA